MVTSLFVNNAIKRYFAINYDIHILPTINFIQNKMGCFNVPALKVCGWGGVGGWWVADTNYLYPAQWGWINRKIQV